MNEPNLALPFNVDLTPEANISAFPPVSESATGSQANPSQVYTVIPTGSSDDDWFIPLHVVTTSRDCDLPTMSCWISSLYDELFLNTSSYLHRHGHRHPQRQIVQCPFEGCSSSMLWMNIPRHIQSIHLGVRFRCPNCDKPYTRSLNAR
ncbi:hypothetical protein V8E55_008969 [Tylopilus felleus]